MYRYGDGTPFPLDENFIETLTSAVEACTNAFLPLTELDGRRERAREARREADREVGRLDDLEKSVVAALGPYLPSDKKLGTTATVAQKMVALAKSAATEAKQQLEARVRAAEVQASPRTSADAVVQALAPFFNDHQLPKSTWIMAWDVRGAEPAADAVAAAGRIQAAFALAPDPYRAPIRVEQMSDGVIVHMMKKGVFGKAKPAPVDLAKYVMVAFERTHREQIVTLKENANRASPGLRFALTDTGATWTAITTGGDADGDSNPLDPDDVPPIRALADRAHALLKDLINRRSLVELTFGGKAVSELDEPRIVPLELLQQLTPLARTIRERSRASGELVLKRDIGDGRREELFVPRATLAQQFARLPPEYRRPFEDMGISAEQTQPAIQLPRAPAGAARHPATVSRSSDTESQLETNVKTIEVDSDID
ncbi:MAG TPA: hypothetical protein VNO30_06960 [Kofleriaceae bacterium]|nr:hypothetical protein [Kofleriaceae bacterium]